MQDPRSGLAAYYDLSATFPDDIPFYLSRLTPSTSSVLELGCGTGRVSASLAARAESFVGVDYSVDMAAACEMRLESAGLLARSKVLVGDITSIDLGRTFDLIVAPFRVIQNIEDDSGVDGLFRSIARHLHPSGRCILNVFRPKGSPEELVRTWPRSTESRVWDAETPEGTVVRFDRRTRLRESPLTLYPDLIYRTYLGGTVTKEVVHSIVMRCYFPDEFLQLIERQGFTVLEKWGGYKGEDYGKGSELVVEFGLDA